MDREDEELMQSENRVILVGNLGGDAELRSLGDTKMALMNLATSEQWVGKDGSKQNKTEWHRVAVFGKPADALAPYLTKGRAVYVTGKITYREYEKDGVKRYTTEIRADRIILLGHQAQEEAESTGLARKTARQARAATPEADDDIPF